MAIVAGEGEGTISIHAPTRGATIARDMVDFFFIRFQSTLPRGERRYGLDGYTVANVFQSTLPRGERHPALRSPPRISSFQSTLPRGERQLAELLDCVSKGNFNPRSHEGSDDDDDDRYYVKQNFNPRSHEGSDTNAEKTLDYLENFNPRSHEGSDSDADISFLSLGIFQSTLPRGERHL